MAASTAFSTGLLELLLQNLALANIGDASGLQPSSAAGDLYIALHTATPGAGGNQSTNEAAYTGYARVGVVRSSAGWAVSGDAYSNTAAITFGACTAGSETETYFSIGTSSTGAGEILLFGALTSSLAVSAGITPSFATGQLSGTAS